MAKGYQSTSIENLLLAKDLNKGGLYCHFKSKRDIWYSVYEESVKIWRRQVLDGLRDIPDPTERIKKAVENEMLNYLGTKYCEGG